MAALRHADREVLVLRYLEVRPTEEIADLLGIARAAADPAAAERQRDRVRRLWPGTVAAHRLTDPPTEEPR